MLLTGAVPPPEWAQGLVKTLEQCTGLPGGRKWIEDGTPGLDGYNGHGDAARSPGEYAFNGVGSQGNAPKSPSLLSRRKKASSAAFPPGSWGTPKPDGSYFGDQVNEFGSSSRAMSEPAHSRANSRDLASNMGNLSLADGNAKLNNPAPATFNTHFDSDFMPDDMTRQHPHLTNSSTASSPPVARGIAHPSIATVGRSISGYTAPQVSKPGDLVDVSDGGQSSPLDFDPLGGSHRPQTARSASNPFFGVDHAARAPSPLGPPGYDLYGRSSLSQPHTASYPNATTGSYGGGGQRASIDDDLYSGPATGSGGGRRSSIGGRGSASPGPHLTLRPELAQPLPSYAVGRAIALYDFAAAQEGDLSFKMGQVVTILEKSDTTNTWCVAFYVSLGLGTVKSVSLGGKARWKGAQEYSLPILWSSPDGSTFNNINFQRADVRLLLHGSYVYSVDVCTCIFFDSGTRLVPLAAPTTYNHDAPIHIWLKAWSANSVGACPITEA